MRRSERRYEYHVVGKIRTRLCRRLRPKASRPRPSLNDIGLATGTDKASVLHDYLGVYENNLRHLRDRDFVLVEIGVHQGASVRMWEQYFSRARIIGVDIKPECKQFESDRVEIQVGDQGNQGFLSKLAKRRPLVVVDDGSHRWHHQINTFKTLWPHIPPGGVFVVEDIHTSFGRYIPVYGHDGETSAYDFAAGIARHLVASDFDDSPADDFAAYCRATIESMVFLRHSLIIHKKRFKQPRFKVGSVRTQAGTVWSTELGEAYDRLPAEVVGANNHVTRTFNALVADSPVAVRPAWSGVLSDVTVYGSGPTATSDRVLLDETLNCARNVRRTSGLYRTADDRWVVEENRQLVRVPGRKDGRTRVLLKQTWDANYGHWLIDAFPKVGLLHGHLDLSDCSFVVNDRAPDNPMRRIVIDSLGLVGINPDQIEFMPAGAYHFDELAVLGTISRHPVTKTPFAIRFLEAAAESVGAGPHQRIYLSRNGYSRRRLVNEDEIVARLAPHGYELVRTENLSLRDQIAMLKGATHVVGNMGAAFTNLAFSPPGVSVLTLATETMPHDYFYDIVCHKQGARYRGLQGRAVGDEGPNMSSDFEIDLARFDRCLEWLHP